ncbi:alpha/beta hydrolase [Empedobacter stercoris]|uniref:Alpha/beta hydrolase n=1 Tax=Empedobacter stercoris TaxID=1628248 RepID=A0ABX1WKT0_9FLAO|nr:alpha/beta hydrolase-fold protein [Empedobacter stercoris]MCA4808404.1 alpha/beta hydrolase [Empedobacter stercoris]NOJ75258.1 alpha/beta hydrolase [Empedobacter stercoris]QNT15514.1 alpha/beta hydrolase [Empedobacter stercoris]
MKYMKSIFNYLLVVISISFFTSCKNSNLPVYNDPIPKHETFTIDSKILNEKRVINVWVPKEYSTSQDSLSVLYMPDGGTKEDFPHIANTLDSLITSKKIKPVILVGIENIQRRKDLSPPTENEEDKKIADVVGGSNQFRSFVKDELFPEITKKYRTKNNKGIIGESLAGLFIMETFLKQPEMFDYYIAIDPSLWWYDHKMLLNSKNDLAKFPSTPKKLWFAGSGASDILPYTDDLKNILTQEKLPNLQWNYSPEPKEEHATIYRATKEKALIWSIGK